MTTNQLLQLLSFAIAWTIGAIIIFLNRKKVVRLDKTLAAGIIGSLIGINWAMVLNPYPPNYIANFIGATMGAILGVLLSLYLWPILISKDDKDSDKKK